MPSCPREETHSPPLWLKALAFWFALLPIPVALGAVRDLWLAPAAGELRAHQAGTLAACLAMFAAISWFTRKTKPSPAQALGMGVLWLGMALAFEFGVLGLIAGRPWERLLADYRLWEGRLLVLLWLTVVLGPWLSLRLARRGG